MQKEKVVADEKPVRAYSKVSARQKSILLSHMAYGLSIKDAASTAGINYEAAKSFLRVHRLKGL